MNLNKRLMLLTAVFSTFSYTTQARYLTAKDIYNYAQSRNYYALSRITRYIDMQDNSGNTALCLAVIDDDYQAYNLLRQYGANPQPYCLQSAIAASNSSTFLGMGTTGWLTTGAIVAAGAGIAVAAGGGGGGGGSSSSNSGNNGSNDVFGQQTTKNIGKQINGVDEEDGDGTITNYAYNNSDVKLNTNSADTATGLRIIGQESVNAGKIGTHTATVNVKQTGDGNVYGVQSEFENGSTAYNALAEADTELSQTQNATAVSNGLINVLNLGNGNTYGMSASQLTNAAGYAYTEENRQTANAKATGRIYLVNSENSNANMYGMYADYNIENAVAYPSDAGTTAKATGVINLINKGSGNAYGMYAPYAHNNSDENATSTIEMVNKSDGLAVGIYSKDGTVENSGEIKIHNLADGVAVGIYADGATSATNSGTITIDRSDYTDDMATDTTSDDYTYIANSTKGGKAIGIYGAAGSSITNTGTIRISGANTAYGIYSEGEGVTNTGTILIDGNSNHENAVKLNGGTLFQNGTLYAGADWGDEDPCQSVTCGANATCSVVGNSGVCACNSGYEGNANTGCTLIDTGDITDIDTGSEIVKKHIAKNNLESSEDEDGTWYYGANNTNIKAITNSESSVTGLDISNDIFDVDDWMLTGNSVNVDSSGSGNASIEITQRGLGNVYGIRHLSDKSVDLRIGNAIGHNADGTIKIVDTSNNKEGNIYGIYSNGTSEGILNATPLGDGTSSDIAKGTIDITSTGNKNVYGISLHSTGKAYNATGETASGRAIGMINIVNGGTGNVYGIEATGDVYNAESWDKNLSEGTITIENSGSGDIYGLKSQSTAFNAVAYQESKATGLINLINKGSGNAYGMYAKNTKNKSNSDITSSIELTNQGNGLAVGIYSKDGTAENSGDIKIHNLVDGVAVGIYADGTTSVENSGTITIDRGENSTKGGKAIGIYGAANSNITNTSDGIIRINNADKAYGIYTEGGNVTNNGKIYMDNVLKTDQCTGSDCLSENHAIVLNGGTLLQNGTIYAEADWGDDDPCQSVICGANATCSVVGNSGVCSCNSGYEGNANTGCTLIAEENTDNIGKVLNDDFLIAGNNEDVKVDVSSDNETIGLQIKAQTAANAKSESVGESQTASVNVVQSGNGDTYGMLEQYEDYPSLYNAYAVISAEGEVFADGLVNVSNSGNGNVYGIKASNALIVINAAAGTRDIPENKTADAKAIGKIRIYNSGSGNMYGIYGDGQMYNSISLRTEATTAKATGLISLINKGSGNAYGMYSETAGNYIHNNRDDNTSSIIEMVNKGDGLAVGIYSKNGTVENSGDIKIHNLGNGKAFGIYADGTTNVTNSGTITIDRESFVDDMATENTSDDVPYTANPSTTDMAIGIYGAKDSTITNTSDGKIYINSASTAYGIYTEGGESSVINDGTILINGQSSENVIRTNGGTLFQNGTLYIANGSQTNTMSVSSVKPASLNLNDFGGIVVASGTSQFIVEGAISGDLAINNSVIENGFNTTYSVKNMIQAEDTSGLNLQSQSALFDATLKNNTDAVMTMKAFNDVVDNSSVADFLQNNYAEGNNEKLFSTLKSASSVAQLNNNIDDLFGKNMLSRMAFEDLSMLREVNFDMNNHMFEKEGSFAFGENISPSSYDNNIGSVGRYSLNGYNNGKMSFGIGVSITDVRTDDGNNDNRRIDRNFMMSAPIGYKTHGFELITAPKMGYADGTYDRDGFNNMTYDGKVQKRMFALMNEARYPIKFGGLKLIPSTEFNMIGYNIKGHEDDKEYSLRIKSQNHYSVEAGLGLMAEKEFKPYKNHKFNLNGGVAVYHEFANPYELDVAMNGMSGTYRLQDEKRSDNRAVVRFGFGYELKDNVDVSASWLTNIDREYRTDAKIDLKYHF